MLASELFKQMKRTLVMRIESSPAADHGGLLALGNGALAHQEETSGAVTLSRRRRLGASTSTPAAWTVCLLSHEGASRLHRPMNARPEPVLQALAPSQASGDVL
jgi:hypothetical protein